LAAVIANWISTGDHLLYTLGNGYWPVAGIDLALLTVSSISVVVAVQLRRREFANSSSASLQAAVDVEVEGA
jgi:hypothetical protein